MFWENDRNLSMINLCMPIFFVTMNLKIFMSFLVPIVLINIFLLKRQKKKIILIIS